jgi:hypothetical protein
MAEPSAEERDMIVGAFLREYNRENGTAYAYAKEGSAGTEVDWICEDPARPNAPLKLQHVRAWADEQTEIVHPKAVYNYVVRRLKSLANEWNVTGYHVSLHVPSLPRDKKDREYLISQDLWNTILHGTRQLPIPVGYARVIWFNKTEIEHYYKDLSEYVADLEILKVADGEPFAVAWSSDPGGGVADGVYRASEAIEKKALRYGASAKDVVLLVDFEVIPYYEAIDVPDLQAWTAKRGVPFKEVWLTAGLWVNQRAHRVWPADKPSESPPTLGD